MAKQKRQTQQPQPQNIMNLLERSALTVARTSVHLETESVAARRRVVACELDETEKEMIRLESRQVSLERSRARLLAVLAGLDGVIASR